MWTRRFLHSQSIASSFRCHGTQTKPFLGRLHLSPCLSPLPCLAAAVSLILWLKWLVGLAVVTLLQLRRLQFARCQAHAVLVLCSLLRRGACSACRQPLRQQDRPGLLSQFRLLLLEQLVGGWKPVFRSIHLETPMTFLRCHRCTVRWTACTEAHVYANGQLT